MTVHLCICCCLALSFQALPCQDHLLALFLVGQAARSTQMCYACLLNHGAC